MSRKLTKVDQKKIKAEFGGATVATINPETVGKIKNIKYEIFFPEKNLDIIHADK